MKTLTAPTVEANRIDLTTSRNRTYLKATVMMIDYIGEKGLPMLFHMPRHADFVEVFDAVYHDDICA